MHRLSRLSRCVVPQQAVAGQAPRRTLFGLPGLTPNPQVHQERRILKFPPELVYDVVSGVDEYKYFVPWCVDSHVLSKRGNRMRAELSVGFRLFKENYISNVSVVPGHKVTAEAKETQLFKYLNNEWVLHPGPEPGTCWTNFRIDFCFRSVVYAQASALFFDEVVYKMVQAFEKRCAYVAERRRSEFDVSDSDDDILEQNLGIRIMETSGADIVSEELPNVATTGADIRPEDVVVVDPLKPSMIPPQPPITRTTTVTQRSGAASAPSTSRVDTRPRVERISLKKPKPLRQKGDVRPLPNSIWFQSPVDKAQRPLASNESLQEAREGAR